MPSLSAYKRVLRRWGYSLKDFDDTREYYRLRGFCFNYSGGGRYRGKFHVSRLTGGDGKASFDSVRMLHPCWFIDKPDEVIEKFNEVF